MTDCPNGEIRDQLPDYLSGRLDAASQRGVQAHLAQCADCQAEFALLGDLRTVMRRGPVIDAGAITAAIPVYRAPVQRSWVGWRTAAAVTLILGGASSLVIMKNGGGRLTDSSTVLADRPSAAPASAPVVQSVPPAAHATAAPVASTPAASVSAPSSQVAVAPARPVSGELALSSGPLGELSDAELASFMKEIESLDVLPSTDVEAVETSPIAPSVRRRVP